MSTDHLTQLVEALTAIYNPNTLPTLRLEAQKFIETNQESIETAIKIISTTAFPLQIRYHGFHIISNYIKKLNGTLITELKSYFHSFLSQKLLVSKLLIKKFADIYTSFILKTWPLNYMELDQILIENFLINPEIILYTLKQLMQDIFIFDHQTSNKKEIVCGLHGLFLDSRQDLNEQASEYQKFLKTNFPSNIGWFLRINAVLHQLIQNDQDQDLVVLLLEVLQTLFEWFPLNSIDAETVALLQKLSLKQNPEIQKISLEALIVLYKRHYSQHDNDSSRHKIFLDPIFESDFLIKLHKLYSASDYNIQKLVASLLSEFLIHQICFKRNLDYQPRLLKDYIELMTICSKNKSVFVSKIIYNGFITAFRHPFIKTLIKNYVDLFLGIVLFTLTDEFVKMQNENLDMDDCGKGDVGMMTVHKLELCGFMGELNSFESYLWISNAFIESFQNTPMQKHVVRMFESLVHKIPREFIEENQELQGMMKKLLENLLDFETNDYLLIINNIHMIASFSVIMELFPDLLSKCLEKFLRFYTLILSSKEDISEVHRKTNGALLKLSKNIPDLILPYVEKITMIVLDYRKSQMITLKEYLDIIGFVCSVIFGCGQDKITNEQKSRFIDGILESYIVDLVKIQPFISSTSAFSEFIGLAVIFNNGVAMPTTPQWETLIEKRKEFELVRVSFSLWIKRAIAASQDQDLLNLVWKKYLTVLASILFEWTRRIHEIWNPQFWIDKPENIKKLLQVTENEKKMLLQIEFDPEEKNAPITPFQQLWRYLGRERENCYKELGLYSQIRSFYDLDIVELISGIFEHIENIAIYHWKSIIHNFISPLILNIPSDKLQLVSYILPPISRHIINLLKSNWQNKLIIAEKHEFDEIEDLSDDILLDIYLRTMTRQWTLFFQNIFQIDKSKDEKSKPKHQNLIQYFLKDLNLIEQVMEIIIFSISIPDTQVCKMGLVTATNLIDLFNEVKDLEWFFADRLLNCVILVLRDGYQKSNHPNCILLIVTILQKVKSAFETIAKIPGVDFDSFIVFQQKLGTECQMKESISVTGEFFKGIIGLEVADWGKLKKEVIRLGSAEQEFFQTKEKEKNILNESNENIMGIFQ